MFDPAHLRQGSGGSAEARPKAESQSVELPPAADRRMKVSPLDLRQLRFRTTFRGFDRAEVLALIAEVADDYENALREVDRLRQEVSKMEALLSQHREHERNLRDTLMTAQRVSEDIRANADVQARQILRDAEGRSDLLLQKTQARLEDVQREIDGMRLQRREVETTLESMISALRNTLEFVREQGLREREEKILLHPQRTSEPQPDAPKLGEGGPARLDESRAVVGDE
jgi:cell division initiation protein